MAMTGLSAKTAVIYFSATGTTERMAKGAAASMGADIFEIQPVHKYSDADLNWHDKKSLTTIECNDPKSRPAIKAVVSTSSNKTFDISSYDTVVLCYPIWWAYAPKIIYTFAESQNWSGKKLITLCTSVVISEYFLYFTKKILKNYRPYRRIPLYSLLQHYYFLLLASFLTCGITVLGGISCSIVRTTFLIQNGIDFLSFQRIWRLRML